MTDKQTAMMIGFIQSEVYRARDNIAHWYAAHPDANAEKVSDKAQTIVNMLGLELGDLVEKLED